MAKMRLSWHRMSIDNLQRILVEWGLRNLVDFDTAALADVSIGIDGSVSFLWMNEQKTPEAENG